MKREQEEKVPQTYKSDPERLAEKVQYRIDGEIKYFCLADGSRQIRGDATDCEMKLWAECLRLMAQQEHLRDRLDPATDPHPPNCQGCINALGIALPTEGGKE